VSTPPPPDTSDAGAADLIRDRYTSEAEEETSDRSRMTFLEHLDELRRRIIYSLYALIAACLVTFWYVTPMSMYMLRYFAGLGGTSGKLVFQQLTEGFMFNLKIGALAGLIVASPFIFAQLWLFVAPGLYTREKKVVVPFVTFSTVLFVGGAAFAHIVAFPSMFKFFVSFSNEYMQGLFPIREVFAFYVQMVLGLGLVFEIPILVFFLAHFGIVTAGFLLRKTKYAILIIFIIAAIITPSPDPINQCIFAAPMLVLYAISIGVAWMFGKKKPAAAV
jgi:sec-independent protein translocase protein TatC